MKLTNTPESFGILSIVLHWTVAILAIGLFVLGKYMVNLDYYDPWYHTAPWLHKSIGVSVFILLLVRIAWRLTNAAPQPLQSYKKWEIITSKAVHFLLYVLILSLCMSGYFISTSKGAPVDVFGFFNLPSLIEYGEVQAELSGNFHKTAAHILLILFALHVFAALKHHFINRDATFVRMLKPSNEKEKKV